jgi:hypothetical protein
MMAAFDAAIFDLVRIGLKRKTPALAEWFGKDAKYTIEKIAQLGSFDALQEDIITTQLKKRYVRELLCLLADKEKLECVDTRDGEEFARLIEIINRRNLHLHSRGVVDERYLEAYNLDKLKLGDTARVDELYWQLAKGYCTYCVRMVAIWAET